MEGIGIALLVVGVILAVFGVRASESLSSNVSTAVTGAPTNRSIGLLVTGIGAGPAPVGWSVR